MDTNQKNRENRQRRLQQGSAQRPTQNSKRTQPASQQKTARRKAEPANNRSRQEQAARAAKIKAMRKQTEDNNRSKREEAARAAKVKAMRQDAEKKAVKRKVSKPRRPMQPVVYTEPKAFNRNRLIIQLITIMAVVMALILGLSIFFKVETITVSGADAYSAWTVREASGIQEGDNLMTFSRAKASARIRAELPYVESVRIGIKLPNTVNIEITEIDVVYAIQCQNNIWWLITSEGEVMEQSDAGAAGNYTQVLGVKLNNPIAGEQAHAYENIAASDETEGEGSTEAAEGETVSAIPVTVTGQQRLSAALQILQALELNDIVGEVASVNVEELSRIVLWYGTRYEVNLGDTNKMDYKIASMNYTIAELSSYETGSLDVSFTTWPDKVGYTPFE